MGHARAPVGGKRASASRRSSRRDPQRYRRELHRSPRQIEWDAAAATRGAFRHYLRKEINDQPQAWIDTMAGRAVAGSSTVHFESDLLPTGGRAAIGRIVMVGAGASWITSQIGKFMI